MKEMVHLQFLHRVRRRWLVWRCAECAGIGAAMGAGMALLGLPLLVWRGGSVTQLSCAAPLIGAFAGLFYSLLRRPTLPATAMEVDRQLQLRDLLGTALANESVCDDSFGRQVLAMADAACAAASPNALLLRRLGARAWGGIGIVAALLLTLTMMTTRPRWSLAGLEPARDPGAPTAISSETARAVRDGLPVDRSPRRDDSPRRETKAASSSGSAEKSPSDHIAESRPAAGMRGNGSGDSAGGADGRTRSSKVPAIETIAAAAALDAETGQPGGGGAAGTSSAASNVLSVGEAVQRAGQAPPAEWNKDIQPADRQAALRRIDNGQIPDAYRDLVRDYFTRDEEQH